MLSISFFLYKKLIYRYGITTPKRRQRKAQPTASSLLSTTIKQIRRKIGIEINDPSKIYETIFANLFNKSPLFLLFEADIAVKIIRLPFLLESIILK